LRLGLARGAP